MHEGVETAGAETIDKVTDATRSTLDATRESGRRRLEEVNNAIAPAAARARDEVNAAMNKVVREPVERARDEVNAAVSNVAPAAAAALGSARDVFDDVAPAAAAALGSARDVFAVSLPENINNTREQGRRTLEEVNAQFQKQQQQIAANVVTTANVVTSAAANVSSVSKDIAAAATGAFESTHIAIADSVGTMAGKAFGEMRKIDEAMKLKLPQSHDNEIMLPSGEVVAAKVGRGAARLSTQQQMDLQRESESKKAMASGWRVVMSDDESEA